MSKEDSLIKKAQPQPIKILEHVDGHVEIFCAVICINQHLTVRNVAGEVGISIASFHQILTKKHQMLHITAKFVPHLLADVQKENMVDISQEVIVNVNGNKIFQMEWKCPCKVLPILEIFHTY